MSRTTRRHEAPARQKRRGPKNRPTEDAPLARLKSHKQTRANTRAQTRREWL